MVDAIVSTLLEQLISVTIEEATARVRLVVGVDDDVKNLKKNLETIKGVLSDVEQWEDKVGAAVKVWLDDLRDSSYDMEDVLDEWHTARLKLQNQQGAYKNACFPSKKKVCSFFTSPCFPFTQVSLRHDIARSIQKINKELNDITLRRDKFDLRGEMIRSGTGKLGGRVPSISSLFEDKICGRDSEEQTLISKLLCESTEKQNIISIVGMGGIGKTTLAKLVFNNDRVKNHFEKRIWVFVSNHFDEFRIAKAILEELQISTLQLNELQSLVKHIEASIMGKKFLLVLDDVWNEDRSKWDPFSACLNKSHPESKILITTRKETVAHMMGSVDTITIKELVEEECQLLFKHIAFSNRLPLNERLEEIGKKIVGKCKGLPLAVKTIASFLRSKPAEVWQNTLESDMWELEGFRNALLASLLLSYNDLPPMIKRCFLYCAVFTQGSVIEKDELIKLWMAQGYLEREKGEKREIIGEEYFDYLATRSFLQGFQKDNNDNVVSFKMHDIMHAFAHYVNRGEHFYREVTGVEDQFGKREDSSSVGKRDYGKFRHSRLVLHKSIFLDKSKSYFFPILKARKLRSLFIDNSYIDSEVMPTLLDKFRRLRALSITGLPDWASKPEYAIKKWPKAAQPEKLPMKKFPREIDGLMHLRYLKLSRLLISELPKECYELYNLQTLHIHECQRLKSLPQGIEKLANLRYLIYQNCDSLLHTPNGIERLTCLRTLNKFYVGKGCSLKALKHLKQLQGSLEIGELQNVKHADEARNARLEEKNLSSLSLSFAYQNNVPEAVREALRPPQKLKQLEMRHCGGTTLPSWMVSLNKLKSLTLSYCLDCEHLPPLGNLSFLEKLKLVGLRSVTRLDDEFIMETKSDQDSSSSSLQSTAFPRLKSLEIWFLTNLEKWDYDITRNEKQDIKIMPVLSFLKIDGCRKLNELPVHLQQRQTTLKIDWRRESDEAFQKGRIQYLSDSEVQDLSDPVVPIERLL